MAAKCTYHYLCKYGAPKVCPPPPIEKKPKVRGYELTDFNETNK